MVEIDQFGRIVIPKEIWDRLGVAAHTPLELSVADGELTLRPVRRRGRRIVEIDGLPAVEAEPGVSLTEGDVQWLRDEQR